MVTAGTIPKSAAKVQKIFDICKYFCIFLQFFCTFLHIPPKYQPHTIHPPLYPTPSQIPAHTMRGATPAAPSFPVMAALQLFKNAKKITK